jgi:hypothetical protein
MSERAARRTGGGRGTEDGGRRTENGQQWDDCKAECSLRVAQEQEVKRRVKRRVQAVQASRGMTEGVSKANSGRGSSSMSVVRHAATIHSPQSTVHSPSTIAPPP